MFRTAAHSGSLVRYLEPFAHTVGVMQTPEALHRVAFECVEDLAADNVVYAEVRFAPELHIDGGLSLDAVVDAVLAGFADGEKAAAAAGRRHRGALPGHRDAARRPVAARSPSWPSGSATRASSASTSRAPRPATRRRGTSMRSSTCGSNNARFTIHAGEAFGLPSIHEAIAFCGADRLGHGVRIVDDIEVASRRRPRRWAGWHRCCGTSGFRSSCARAPTCRPARSASIAEHPFDLLARLRFRVTVNTDNRLMSDTTMSQEMLRLVEAFGYGWSDLERFTINAMKSAFISFDERLAHHRRGDQAALRRARRLALPSSRELACLYVDTPQWPAFRASSRTASCAHSSRRRDSTNVSSDSHCSTASVKGALGRLTESGFEHAADQASQRRVGVQLASTLVSSA